MGSFTVGCLIKNQVDREKAVRIPRLMVDTGSEATWIPRKLLEQIEVKPEKRLPFQWRTANMFIGTSATPLFAWTIRETVDEVVFAEQGDHDLIGRAGAGRFAALD